MRPTTRSGATPPPRCWSTRRRAVQDAGRRPKAVARTIAEPRSAWRATLRALRPHQWVKNALCLIPPLAAGDLRNPHAWAATLAVAVAFCLVASGIYLFNDLADLAADRASARKSRRPFASGALSPLVGLALAPPLLLAGGALGWRAGAAPALGAYLALSLGYNLRLKEMPLIDVFVLAALYTIRLFGGGEASGHAVSLWLLGFSSFLFLGLALVKRVSELQRVLAAGGRSIARRGYLAEDVLVLQMFGTAAAFASVIVLSLYVQSEAVMRLYAQPVMLWGSIPLLLFWQCRLWLATARGYMHDDPIVYAARDWVSWLVCLGLAGVVGLAWAPVWSGERMPVALLIAFSVGCSALAQVALRQGMRARRACRRRSRPGRSRRWCSRCWAACRCWAGSRSTASSAASWLFVLARLPVSVAYAFMALGFLLTMALGCLLLNEPFTARKAMGTLAVVLGLWLVAGAR